MRWIVIGKPFRELGRWGQDDQWANMRSGSDPGQNFEATVSVAANTTMYYRT